MTLLDKNFSDLDTLVENLRKWAETPVCDLESPSEILRWEIDWCLNNPGHGVSTAFENGYIDGLRRAVQVLEQDRERNGC